jgi:hypothetical protein
LDRVFAMAKGNKTYFIVADATGTPHFVLDGETGEPVNRKECWAKIALNSKFCF